MKTLLRIWSVNFANGEVETNKGVFTLEQWYTLISKFVPYTVKATVSDCGQIDAIYYCNGEVRPVKNGWVIPKSILK